MARLASPLPYAHRPTDLAGVNTATDRAVLFDGERIGRVRLDVPLTGRWQWCCQFLTKELFLDHTGRVDTMEAALVAVKERHERLGRPGGYPPPATRTRPPIADF